MPCLTLQINAKTNPLLHRALENMFREIHVEAVMQKKLGWQNKKLLINGKPFVLPEENGLHIIGFGKASAAMAKGLLHILQGNYRGIISGDIITKYGHGLNIHPLHCHEAGHPLPDLNSVQATDSLCQNIQKLPEKTPVIALLSGGASALLCKPEGISLNEKQELTEKLLKSGADINEINRLRQKLSAVKGGRLADMVHPRPTCCLIISDVIGDHLSIIGSGPLYREKGKIPHHVISNLSAALDILERELCTADINIMRLKKPVVSENDTAVEQHLKIIRKNRKNRPFCLLSGGETTVKIKGNGKGGRNMHFALALGMRLLSEKIHPFEIISAGTDGTDGPTDATGAYVTDKMLQNHIDTARVALLNNDSYPFLQSCGGLIKTGPTGTNINDVHLIYLSAGNHKF
jgi:hydroxypyruvate reductase